MSARQSLALPLRRLLAALRRRALLRRAPLAVAAGLLVAGAWRAGLPPAMTIALAVAAVLVVVVGAWRIRARRDLAWLLRRLDARLPSMDDSSDLLAVPEASVQGLALLQRRRLERRIAGVDAASLREPMPAWPGLVVLVLSLAWFAAAPMLVDKLIARTTADGGSVAAAPVAPAQSLQARVELRPPAYTGLPVRSQQALDIEVEEGGEVRWSLGFAVEPAEAVLVFVDGRRVPLSRGEQAWQASLAPDDEGLYRIELDGAPQLPEAGPFRLQLLPDQPPDLRIVAPAQTLTIVDQAGTSWELAASARDNYGLGPAALVLTHAQGDGEQVTVSERRVALRGEGSEREQAYRHHVDLRALGFAPGDDLIARFEASDRREPEPGTSRSPALILRWARPPAREGTGVEGIAQDAMPAYFRSQRQIIIDTEALIADMPGLDADRVLSRSDALGVDQRILRLRYGQFLGEEAEGIESAAPEGEGGEDGEEAHHEGDGHDHGDEGAQAAAPFGEVGGLIASAGHLHDLPEAATLLDPATRRLLRAALREMWEAELQLRLGQPRAALPFEYRALELIKQVQQANRIYLARVGLELPPLDPRRRLSGERDPLPTRPDPLVAAERDAAVVGWWSALASGEPVDLAVLARWLGELDPAPADRLLLLGEIDRLQRDASCGDCRRRLAAGLWPLLPTMPAAPATRPDGGAAGRAYLGSLSTPGEDRP